MHITDEFNIEDINETAAPLKYEDNELERTSLTLISSSIIQTPAVKEANIRFECKLDQMIQLGTKNDGADLIIGEVVMYHINEDVYFEDSKIDFNQLKPVARLAEIIILNSETHLQLNVQNHNNMNFTCNCIDDDI